MRNRTSGGVGGDGQRKTARPYPDPGVKYPAPGRLFLISMTIKFISGRRFTHAEPGSGILAPTLKGGRIVEAVAHLRDRLDIMAARS